MHCSLHFLRYRHESDTFRGQKRTSTRYQVAHHAKARSTFLDAFLHPRILLSQLGKTTPLEPMDVRSTSAVGIRKKRTILCCAALSIQCRRLRSRMRDRVVKLRQDSGTDITMRSFVPIPDDA